MAKQIGILFCFVFFLSSWESSSQPDASGQWVNCAQKSLATNAGDKIIDARVAVYEMLDGIRGAPN